MAQKERTPRTLIERTVKLTKQDLVRMDTTPFLNLSDLNETAAYKLPDADGYMLIECEPSRRATACPVCKASGYMVSNGYTQFPRLVHDVNVGLTQVDLSVTVPRYECRKCGAKSSAEFESIVPGRQFTKRLFEQIKVDAFYGKFADIAMRFGIADTTVGDIFDEYAEELEARHKTQPVGAWLAIDEKHVQHKARGIFVDGETSLLIEMTEDNSPQTVTDTIRKIPGYENIKIITMDMSATYRKVVEEIFGQDAKIIVDKWHVLNQLSIRIAKSKTAIIEYLNDEIKAETDPAIKDRKTQVKKLVTDNGYLFKYNEENLKEKPMREQIMAEACAMFPVLNHLRLLKEGFEHVYACTDRTKAQSTLESWCELVPPSGKLQIAKWEEQYHVPAVLYQEFRSFKETVSKSWHKEIFNYFDVDGFKTNAIAEATNAFIERVIINGYSFRRLRAKALFWHEAGERKRYVMDVRHVFDPDASNQCPQGTMSFVNPGAWYSSTKTILSIEEKPEQVHHRPLSVLSFLPESRKREIIERW